MRGATLGTVLLVSLLVATMAFALSAASLTHLNLVNQAGSSQRALNLARSAVALGLERIQRDAELANFGVDRAPGQVLRFAPSREEEALLTFSPAEARGLGIGLSTNNLPNALPTPGWQGRAVPGHTAHLVGQGRCRGVNRTIEVILVMPPYPYAVGSSGPISAQGLLLGSYDPSRPGLDPEHLGPADLLSNASDADAVSLGEACRVRGNVVACGDVELRQVTDPSQAPRVDGDIQAGSRPTELPDFDLPALDPETQGRSFAAIAQSQRTSMTVAGVARREGDLTVNGRLELNGALLYVDGNLTVADGITGQGAVVVTGNAEVRGGSSLRATEGTGLLAGGNLTLQGNGPASTRFNGLVYSEGSFRAEQLTIEGALIGNGPDHARNEFENAAALTNPDLARIQLPPFEPAAPATPGPGTGGSGGSTPPGGSGSGSPPMRSERLSSAPAGYPRTVNISISPNGANRYNITIRFSPPRGSGYAATFIANNQSAARRKIEEALTAFEGSTSPASRFQGRPSLIARNLSEQLGGGSPGPSPSPSRPGGGGSTTGPGTGPTTGPGVGPGTTPRGPSYPPGNVLDPSQMLRPGERIRLAQWLEP